VTARVEGRVECGWQGQCRRRRGMRALLLAVCAAVAVHAALGGRGASSAGVVRVANVAVFSGRLLKPGKPTPTPGPSAAPTSAPSDLASGRPSSRPTAQPSTAQPSTAQPSTAQPSTAQPSTARPSTAQPIEVPTSVVGSPSLAPPESANSTGQPAGATSSAAPSGSTLALSSSQGEQVSHTRGLGAVVGALGLTLSCAAVLALLRKHLAERSRAAAARHGDASKHVSASEFLFGPVVDADVRKSSNPVFDGASRASVF
jgi:hypothetical protein